MRRLTLSLPIAALISLLLIAGMAAILWAAGRPLICPCGYVKLWWWGARDTAEESQHLFDIYTFTHVLHGLLFYFFVWLIFRGRLSVWAGLVLAVLIESGWELWENSDYLIKRYQAAGVAYLGDSVINSVGDIAAMVAGYLIAALAPVWLSVFLLIATEVTLAVLIRDNLSLNIISLIRPIEWITDWQARK